MPPTNSGNQVYDLYQVISGNGSDMRTCVRCGGLITQANGGENLQVLTPVHARLQVCLDTLRTENGSLQTRLHELEATPLAAAVDELNALRVRTRNDQYLIAKMDERLKSLESALKSANGQRDIWHKMNEEPPHCGIYIAAAVDGNGDGFYYDSLYWHPWERYALHIPPAYTRHFTGDYEWFYFQEEWPPTLVDPADFLRWMHPPFLFLDDDE